MAAEFETVIGLEVHLELQTKSKIFCACPNRFGEAPNSNVCPVCLGLPGSLPVLNGKVIELSLRAALALNCEVPPYSKFDRKNYFYPDLPKAYQISQYDFPLARNGHLDLYSESRLIRRVQIERLHIEEDAGKLLHGEDGAASLVDYNRSGVPLVEIVTAPDLRSPEEARLFLELLRRTLLYTGVSDCKMEEGSLRCDANISLRPGGEKALGSKVELKNMNSFRSVQKGLEYEAIRQKSVLRESGSISSETRRYDESRGITLEMRGKEEEHDYRYFPEPDLPPLIIEGSRLKEIGESLPELPTERGLRLAREYEIPPSQAEVITASRGLADFYEEAVGHFNRPRLVANWLTSDVQSLVKEWDKEDPMPFTAFRLAELLRLVEDGAISTRMAKEVLKESFDGGESPGEIVRRKGLAQLSDEKELASIAEKVLQEHQGAAKDFLSGNKKSLSFLVGQVMKHTGGKANPQMVSKLLQERLKKT